MKFADIPSQPKTECGNTLIRYCEICENLLQFNTGVNSKSNSEEDRSPVKRMSSEQEARLLLQQIKSITGRLRR